MSGGSDGACADGGSLGIEEDGDFLAATGGEGAKGRCDLPNKVVAGMGHI